MNDHPGMSVCVAPGAEPVVVGVAVVVGFDVTVVDFVPVAVVVNVVLVSPPGRHCE
jgi:hypothetical protein